jgi:hypothetical protein
MWVENIFCQNRGSFKPTSTMEVHNRSQNGKHAGRKWQAQNADGENLNILSVHQFFPENVRNVQLDQLYLGPVGRSIVFLREH